MSSPVDNDSTGCCGCWPFGKNRSTPEERRRLLPHNESPPTNDPTSTIAPATPSSTAPCMGPPPLSPIVPPQKKDDSRRESFPSGQRRDGLDTSFDPYCEESTSFADP